MRHAQLNLQTNKIGAEGAAAIGEALKVNGSLTSLDVRSNNIGPKGAAAFGEALKVNGSLTSLDVSGYYNYLDAASEELLRDTVKDRNGFQLHM